MDLSTLNDARLTRQYRVRLILGIVFMAVLALPLALQAFTAMHQLFNRPSDWINEKEQVRIDFDDFEKRFAATDLVLVSWEGANLHSSQLAAVTQLLQLLCIQTEAPEPSPELPAEDSRTANFATPMSINSDAVGTVTQVLSVIGDKPLHWARSGSELIDRLTAPPLRMPPATAIKRLSGSLVGPDGQQTCIVCSLSEVGIVKRSAAIKAIRQAISQQLKIADNAIYMTGGPYDGLSIDQASIRSIQLFSPPSAIVAALLCLICLRSWVLTATICVVAVFGQGVVLAAVTWSDVPMNAVLIVLPPLVFVLTVSSGIHLSNYYLDALADYPEATRAQAAAIAMKAGTVPCLLAAATTVVGLGSLVLVRLQPIQVFGAVATLGLVVTLALLLGLMPGAMLLFGGKRRKREDEILGSFNSDPKSQWQRRLRIFFRELLDHPKTVIALVAIASVLMGLGLFWLRTSINVPRMFDASHPLRTQIAWFEKHLGPSVNGELLLRFPATHLASDVLDRLELVRDAHIAVAKADDIGGVLSAMSFLPNVPRSSGLTATANRSVIRKQLEDPNSSVGQLGFVSRDEVAEVWRISFRLPMTTQSDYSNEIESLRATSEHAIQQTVAKKAAQQLVVPEVVMTGGFKIAQDAQEILLADLFASFLSAFAVVAIVMMGLLRSVRGGLIAMLPNLFPTIWLFGFLGIAKIPLDIGSVMAASVALGIAVDDTIHLLSRFGSRRARGVSRKIAAWGALQQCGMAMVHTTAVCGVSLSVYACSDFVPTRQFAYLMFGLLGIALIGDLILLPALMVCDWGKFLSRPVLAEATAELLNVDIDES